MKSTHNLITAIALLIAGAVAAFAALPQTINYQGYLTTSAGVPAAGPVSMVFSLYSSNPARNNPVWRETQPNVTIFNGIYDTQLGAVTPISAPFDVPYYLGVKVGSDPEMALQPLSAGGYAFRAGTAESLSGLQSVSLPVNGLTVGTNQLVAIDSRIGIGTATPEFTLDVNGTGRFTSNLDLKSPSGQIGFNRNSTNGIIYDNAHSAWQIGPLGTLGDKFYFINYHSNGTEQAKALILQPDGAVNIPGAATLGSLSISGTANLGGNLTFATPKTGYVTVTASAFTSTSSTVTYGSNYGGGNDRYLLAPAGTQHLGASVNLPHGASLQNVTCKVKDNNATYNVTVGLMENINNNWLCSPTASSGASASIQNLVSPCSGSIVDNVNYAYTLKFLNDTACGSTCSIYACTVTYTVSSLP